MKTDANQEKVILALQRAIVATFDDGRWRELGYLTGSIDIIERHPRLLRSLRWGDDDYAGNVFRVLPHIVGEEAQNLAVIEEFVGLDQWLRENDSSLHAELYDVGQLVPLDEIAERSLRLDITELNRHAGRIRRGIEQDPAQAIGSAKELLETVLKTVLGIEGEEGREDIQALLRRAQRDLDLDPKDVDGTLPGADTLRRTLSNLGQIVVGVAEMRNLYGTGHGRRRARELQVAHARLVVNAATTLATFLLEVAEARRFSA